MKQLASILVLAAATMAMCACGSSSKPKSVPVQKLSAGHWVLLEDSVVPDPGASGQHPTHVQLAGELSATGAMMIPTAVSNPCFPSQTPSATPLVFAGATSGNTFVLTQAQTNGAAMTITANINPGNNFVGTYTQTASTTLASCVADNGTVYGTLVPSVSGTWKGTLPGRAGNINQPTIDPTGVVASFVQAAAQSTDVNNNATLDRFPLSGTITLSNPCLASGTTALTIDDSLSFIAGEGVTISTQAAADGTSLALTQVTLNDPTTALVMTVGSFTVSGGPCGGFTGSSAAGGLQITLSKS